DVVFARTGRDIADYRYEPFTFDGTGIVGPAGGRSGGARPIADLALCYMQRHMVDVGAGEVAMPPLAVGASGVLSFSLTNVGYRVALAVSAVVDPGDHAEVVACVTAPMVGGKCQIGMIGPGERSTLEVELLGRSAGEGELTIEVAAVNESSGAQGDNVLQIAYVVEADSAVTTTTLPGDTSGTPTTVPKTEGDTEALVELPFTGPGPDSFWLAVLAGVLVATGGLLLMVRLPQRPRKPREGTPPG
ncbi:MAG TPA: hypothetical protein VK969_12760, partial [Acidimicrobiia bacterium]|nr:hypothetical protein [Acidimicrobiia bacterium]